MVNCLLTKIRNDHDVSWSLESGITNQWSTIFQAVSMLWSLRCQLGLALLFLMGCCFSVMGTLSQGPQLKPHGSNGPYLEPLDYDKPKFGNGWTIGWTLWIHQPMILFWCWRGAHDFEQRNKYRKPRTRQRLIPSVLIWPPCFPTRIPTILQSFWQGVSSGKLMLRVWRCWRVKAWSWHQQCQVLKLTGCMCYKCFQSNLTLEISQICKDSRINLRKRNFKLFVWCTINLTHLRFSLVKYISLNLRISN